MPPWEAVKGFGEFRDDRGLTQEELDKMGKGPVIIKERVRLIAGALTVESNPGQGTRLEIKVAKGGEVSDEL